MVKKLLKQLILASYNQGHLDEKNVLAIADRLDRKELKQYIRALKQAEKARTVVVEIPFDLADGQTRDIQDLFPDKEIVIKKDPSLLAGMRITNVDDILEMNLKHNLDAIITFVTEQYD